jgi:hypothetical protein
VLQKFFFIGTSIVGFFSIALGKVIALHIICLIFGIRPLNKDDRPYGGTKGLIHVFICRGLILKYFQESADSPSLDFSRDTGLFDPRTQSKSTGGLGFGISSSSKLISQNYFYISWLLLAVGAFWRLN